MVRLRPVMASGCFVGVGASVEDDDFGVVRGLGLLEIIQGKWRAAVALEASDPFAGPKDHAVANAMRQVSLRRLEMGQRPFLFRVKSIPYGSALVGGKAENG